MRKNLIYGLFVCAFLLASAFIVYRYYDSLDEFAPLKERVPALANAKEWGDVKQKAAELFAQIELEPNNSTYKIKLAGLYIQEARITGDHQYYDAAAMKIINFVLSKEPNNFEALCFKAIIYLSQHHFAEGLEIATQASAINPHNAYIYGLMTDANVELGDYEVAVAMSDKMMSIRPDLRSYSRVSYLREIYGDYPGSISAMKAAVEAGYPGLEDTEWSRCQLGQLYEKTGKLDTAEAHYNNSLAARGVFSPAYEGLGRVARARGKYADAIGFFLKANELNNDNDYSIRAELAELYAFTGDAAQSDAAFEKALAILDEHVKSSFDGGSGHFADKELAEVYTKRNDLDKALRHALNEYSRRPNNIDVNEVLAWVYYKKGELAKAREHINVALKTRSKNAELCCKAGIILCKTGSPEQGRALLQQALETNPFLETALKNEATTYLNPLPQ